MLVTTTMGGVHEVRRIREWLAERLSSEVDLAMSAIRHDARFDAYGVDSLAAMSLVAQIHEAFRVELEPVTLWDYPTIVHLADHIVDHLEGKPSRAETALEDPITARDSDI